MRRRVNRVLIAALGVALLAIAWPPSRVAIQTAALIPSILDAGPRPLEWLSPAPRRDTLAWRTDADGTDDLADLWLPPSASAEHPH